MVHGFVNASSANRVGHQWNELLEYVVSTPSLNNLSKKLYLTISWKGLRKAGCANRRAAAPVNKTKSVLPLQWHLLRQNYSAWSCAQHVAFLHKPWYKTSFYVPFPTSMPMDVDAFSASVGRCVCKMRVTNRLRLRRVTQQQNVNSRSCWSVPGRTFHQTTVRWHVCELGWDFW